MTPDKPPSGVAGDWCEVGSPEWQRLLRRPRRGRWKPVVWYGLLVGLIIFNIARGTLAERQNMLARAASMVKLNELLARE